MTIEEAIERAKPKLAAREFDVWDLSNLLNAVSRESYEQGRQSSLDAVLEWTKKMKQSPVL